MAALQARGLADDGWTVLQIDLFGCGDSAGEFGAATWTQWIADVRHAARWLQSDTGHAPALWGLRAGCLLAAWAASEMPQIRHLMFWQPVLSGKQNLRQFLRLRVGSQIVSSVTPDVRPTSADPESEDDSDGAEVVGYELSLALTQSMEAAELELPGCVERLVWLELSNREKPELSPASRRWLDLRSSPQLRVTEDVVRGAAFWQTASQAEVTALLGRTTRAARELSK